MCWDLFYASYFSLIFIISVQLLLVVLYISQIASDLNSGTFSLAYLYSFISLEQVQWKVLQHLCKLNVFRSGFAISYASLAWTVHDFAAS